MSSGGVSLRDVFPVVPRLGLVVAGAGLEAAVQDAGELSHVRAEEDAHRVTPVEAAAERVGLLERHLAKCKRLRRELLSGS